VWCEAYNEVIRQASQLKSLGKHIPLSCDAWRGLCLTGQRDSVSQASHHSPMLYAGTSVSRADSGKNSRKHPRWPSNPQQKNYTILDLAVGAALTSTDNKVTALKFRKYLRCPLSSSVLTLIQSKFPRVASLENSSLLT
jgi:hypothetical protein